MDSEIKATSETTTLNEAQLLLAEKRTELAVLRTGFSVFVIPLSVLSLLIATSRYYDVTQVTFLVVPLLLLCAGLVILGIYLTRRSIIKIRHIEHALQQLKKDHRAIARIIDCSITAHEACFY